MAQIQKERLVQHLLDLQHQGFLSRASYEECETWITGGGDPLLVANDLLDMFRRLVSASDATRDATINGLRRICRFRPDHNEDGA